MIICFSGTANSLVVARQLAERLDDRVEMMTTADGLSVAPGERIVWVMPVNSWGLPKAVKTCLRTIRIEGADVARHFLVATCGDDCGLMASMWRKALKRRGWKSVAAHSVFMPNTYVTLPGFNVDSDSVAAGKMSKMPERVAEIAHAIKCGSPIDSIHRGKMPWIKTRILYPLFMRFLTSPKPFRSEGCVRCGKCVKICPLSNIVLDDDGPRWGRNCTLCLGCYHICPGHHIEYGSSTRKKGQWQGSFKRT